MADRTDNAEAPVHLTAGQARDGDIVLRTRRRRGVFVAGLAGIVLVAAFVALAG